MNLSQLNYIVQLANNGTFSKAAEKCFVTQPTLSMQISKLEDELGTLIFDRSRQPVIPTEVGELIIEQSRIILNEVKRLTEISDNEKGTFTGKLRVGVIPTIAPYLIPYFIEDFVKKHPQLKLIIDELETASIVEKLRKGDLDVGILATPLNYDDIYEEILYFEPFVGYVSTVHKFAKLKKIDSEKLNINDIWLLKEGHCFRDHVVKLCESYEKSVNENQVPVAFEGGSLETLMRIVEKNFGMTLLPALVLNSVPDKQKTLVHEFKNPIPYREIGLVYHRSHLKKKIISKLKEQIIENLPNSVSIKKPEKVINWK